MEKCLPPGKGWEISEFRGPGNELASKDQSVN